MIIVPYHRELHPIVAKMLRNYDAKIFGLDDEFGYATLLEGLWCKEDLIIIEQDVIPWPGAIESLLSCGNEWCAYGYENKNYSDFVKGGIPLGCAKFKKGFMEQTKDIWKNKPKWDYCDGHIQNFAETLGISVCHHNPPVTHLLLRHG